MRKRNRYYTRTTVFEVLDAQGRRMDWLAAQAGCSPSYVSKMRHGAKPIPEWFAHRASEALGLPTNVLFFDLLLPVASPKLSIDQEAA